MHESGMSVSKVGLGHRLLQLPYDARGIFRARSNRFLGVVDIIHPGEVKGVEVHVHDPGRLGEILYPGNTVLLKRVEGKHRKTDWDLVAGRVNNKWIPVHSGYHRALSEKIIRDECLCPFGSVSGVYPEVQLGHSRIDFFLEREDGSGVWVEVKGCTLAENGVALFPDAPTTRGRRHLDELIRVTETGGEAAMLILVFRSDARCFAPNRDTDPIFSSTFYEAMERGVKVCPVLLEYDGKWVHYKREIPVMRGEF